VFLRQVLPQSFLEDTTAFLSSFGFPRRDYVHGEAKEVKKILEILKSSAFKDHRYLPDHVSLVIVEVIVDLRGFSIDRHSESWSPIAVEAIDVISKPLPCSEACHARFLEDLRAFDLLS